MVLALGLLGCASVPQVPDAVSGGSIVNAPLDADGRSYLAHWYLPQGEALALVVLEHGFTRNCYHLRETSRWLMTGGLMVLCIDASMAGGNPQLAEALARSLAGGLQPPDGHATPLKIIVAGHSAGAPFAARLGAQLDKTAPQRLAGALFFDAVATAGFAADLRAISGAGRRPLLAIQAEAHGCNARFNAAGALRQVRRDALEAGADGFVGVIFGPGSTHADVEGEDSDWLARAACGQPLPANVASVRELALEWALAIVRGTSPPAKLQPGWRLIE